MAATFLKLVASTNLQRALDELYITLRQSSNLNLVEVEDELMEEFAMDTGYVFLRYLIICISTKPLNSKELLKIRDGIEQNKQWLISTKRTWKD